MSHSHERRRAPAIFGAVALAAAMLLGAAQSAGADPIDAGEATAFGATITVGGETVVPPTPEATSTLPDEDASETLIDIPAEPLAVSGTLNADAAVHEESDIESELTVVEQEVPGPYNASGVATVEELDVLLDSVDEGVSLVTADVVRAEAVAVCTAGGVQYSANSEIINLQIGGEQVPLNEPLEQFIDGLNAGLAESGLNAIVDIERNVVTPTADGIAIDALVVTVLAAAGDDPLGQVRISHAEVNAVGCAPEVVEDVEEAPAPPEPSPSLPRTGADASAMAGVAGLMALAALTLGVVRHRLHD